MPRELTAADFNLLRKAVAHCPGLPDKVGLCTLMVEWEQEMRARELKAQQLREAEWHESQDPGWLIGGGV